MSASELFADLLLLAHVCFSMFVLGGLLMILLGLAFRWQWGRNRRFRLLHLITTMLVVGRVWLGLPCPFSVAEDGLRREISTVCPLGDSVHVVFHKLAFRGRNPSRFAWVTSLIGVVTLATFATRNRRSQSANENGMSL